MILKYTTALPSTQYFGLLTQHRSSTIVSYLEDLSVPILALSDSGTEISHLDLRISSDIESFGTRDYRLSHRRSVSYMLVPWLQPFSFGIINGGHSRLVWITSGREGHFGIALGRRYTGNADPEALFQAPLNRAALNMGAYGEALSRRSPSRPLFAFHEGEAKLFGGVLGSPELFILEY